MVTFLLSVLLAVLDAHLPCSGTESGRPRDVANLASMAKGRALLCLVRKGMTENQVTAILGKPNVGVGFGPGTVAVYDYFDYGVHVTFGGGIVSDFGYYRQVDADSAYEESR